MLKTVCGAVGALVLAAGLAGPAAAADEPITLTISAFTTSNSPNHRLTIDRMIEEIEADSGGKVTFETYFGGTAYGKADRQFDQVQRGLVDISHSLFGYTAGRFPMMALVELPFIYEDSITASEAFWATFNKHLAVDMAGVHPIAIWLTSMQQLHTRSPVDDIADMEGLKIRAGNGIMVETLAAYDAEGILTPAPATYEKLEKGILDGAIGAWGMLRAFNVGEVTSDHLELNISAAPLFLLMNQKKYDALPDDVKALFDRYSTPEAIRSFAEAFAKSDAAGLKIAESEGHTIRKLTDAQRAEWKAKAAPVIAAEIEALEAKGLPARAFLADFEAEYARLKAQPRN